MSTPAPQYYYQLKTKITGVHYEWSFHGNPRSSFGAELHFESGRKENLQLFNRLKQQKEEIENQIGQELVWEESWRSKDCRIVLELNQRYIDDQLKQWAIENMKKLIDVLQPLLESAE